MTAAVRHLETLGMNPEPADDLVLAERVASGDAAALQTLYERYADPLFAFVYHALDGRKSEAEEVWQDALAAAVRALPAYRGQSRFFSWLCSIARHKIADHWRREGRSHLCLVSPEDLTRLIDSGPLPEEVLHQQATCLRVVEILGDLCPDYRAALIARYADGHSVAEVAQLLDRSYKATESILSRAKEAFRAALVSRSEVEL